MKVALAVALAMLAGSGTTVAQTVPQPLASTQASRSAEAPLQGFSVVLVIGDLQGTAATDDIPMAARKALTDMKDFLPYKSYKLLDATWMMCCAQVGRRIGLPGAGTLRESASVTQHLRGPEDQEYELQLRMHRLEGNRISVSFELTGGTGSPTEAGLSGDLKTSPRMVIRETSKSIIDADFTMDIGETVVVGTSRVKGGTRALIALLTAVPPRSGAGNRE
jgi:hypothetical protein